MYTTEDLVEQIRDAIDEVNDRGIKDVEIIRFLNRAQQTLVSEVCKTYNTLFMVEAIYTGADFTSVSSSTAKELEIPSLSFLYRVNTVDVRVGQTWIPVQFSPPYGTQYLDAVGTSSIPLAYSLIGNKLRLYPGVTDSVQIRVRYQITPHKMVSTWGRVEEVDVAAGKIKVDSVTNFTTDVSQRLAFVNVTHPLSGIILGTYQITGIDEDTEELTIKSSDLSRASVYGYTVSTTLSTEIEADCLLSSASGGAVPYLSSDLSSALVELSQFLLKQKMGLVQNADFASKDEVIGRIRNTWAGRADSPIIVKGSRRGRTGLPYVQSLFRGN